MANFADEIGVFNTDRIDPTAPIGRDQKGITNVPGFQPFMQQPTGAQQPGAVSPFSLAQGGQQQALPGKPSVDTLLTQVNNAQRTMGDVNSHLNTPNLRLNRAQKYLLNNKLADAKSNIRSAASKVGVEDTPKKETPAGSSPIAKFIAILTDGQYQLEGAKNQLEEIKSSGKLMHPAELLLMQVKLNKAQVEIEYASVLLAKAVDATKQLFNIQL